MLINGELLIYWNHVIIILCVIIIVVSFICELSNLKNELELYNKRIEKLEKRNLIINDFTNEMKKLVDED